MRGGGGGGGGGEEDEDGEEEDEDEDGEEDEEEENEEEEEGRRRKMRRRRRRMSFSIYRTSSYGCPAYVQRAVVGEYFEYVVAQVNQCAESLAIVVLVI